MVGCHGSSAAREEESLVRLRECGLLTEGDFNRPSDEKSMCRMKCLAELSDCARVESVFCGSSLLDYELSDCMYACYSFSCDERSRVPGEAVCDGIVDCPGGEDERDCGENWLRTCNNGDPVGVNRLCDDYPDCGDQSDEANCSEQLRFTCKNGKTIPPQRECDGHLDCSENLGPSYLPFRDGSDELHCAGAKFFACGDGSYLEPERVCDGHVDCADSSDESLSCAVNTCPAEF